MTTEHAGDFALWRVEFDEGRRPGIPSEEETLNILARYLFSHGWTLEAEQPCVICTLPCRYRRRDGAIVHPVCPDVPPSLTWAELTSGTAQLSELLAAARLGFSLADYGPCASCSGPTRYRRPDGIHLHPLCGSAPAPEET